MEQRIFSPLSAPLSATALATAGGDEEGVAALGGAKANGGPGQPSAARHGGGVAASGVAPGP
ncbi:MAG: hypothetical protein K2X55_28225, partial [Burkholderiaceae bacterium]|nr:hypothetical protein [Burkholderiaceae bacterium]